MSAYLNDLIESYLNDMADYDTDANLVLAESVLKPVKQLLTEGKKDQEEILLEAYRKATPKQKDILEDFLLYVKEGEF
jgi:hypothetical protein